MYMYVYLYIEEKKNDRRTKVRVEALTIGHVFDVQDKGGWKKEIRV